MKCYVYVIKCNNGNRNYPIKVGVAKSPESRLSELQTGNPFPLTLISKVEMPSRMAAYNLESFIHHRIDKYRMSGEWFFSLEVNINGILKAYSKIVDSGAVADLDQSRLSDKQRLIEKSDKSAGRASRYKNKIKSLERKNRALQWKIIELERDMNDYLDEHLTL